MDKLEKALEELKINDLIGKKKETEEKKSNVILWVLAIIGAVAAAAAIGYAVYRYLHPDYLEDFDDDFEDDFEDDEDFFEDEGVN
jgi:flagellar basal body-associated protein FliL